jgi:hypothetical protein
VRWDYKVECDECKHDHPLLRLQFTLGTLDAKAMQTLANLRPNLQLEALRQFFSIDLGQMKNPSAYMSGITRSINRASDNLSLENFKATRVSEQLDSMFRKCGPRWGCRWGLVPLPAVLVLFLRCAHPCISQISGVSMLHLGPLRSYCVTVFVSDSPGRTCHFRAGSKAELLACMPSPANCFSHGI